MSFKLHLIIVAIIIVVMFFITQFFIGNKQAQPVFANQISPYSITIERASWGTNCRMAGNDKNTDNYVQPGGVKIKENNVLYAVSKLCNVKSRCEIAVNQNTLGEDPLPSCGYKILQVEYRCFAVDRIRVTKASDGVLTIDCDQQIGVP